MTKFKRVEIDSLKPFEQHHIEEPKVTLWGFDSAEVGFFPGPILLLGSSEADVDTGGRGDRLAIHFDHQLAITQMRTMAAAIDAFLIEHSDPLDGREP